MSTICAIATPDSVGGISVIRISGDKAIKIASSVFQPFGKKVVEKMEGYTCCYGNIVDGNTRLDDGILTVFKAPHSYTGEDVVEISCHGGIYITREVLRVIIKNGAEPASAGEFTKIAFLNGKISLTQAESIMDLISAQGEQAFRYASSTKEGVLFKKITHIKNSLIKILGELSAWVDYPEEDLPDVEKDTLILTLKNMEKEISDIIATYDSGKVYKNGVRTAIVGKPNVGKSTIMNLLVGFNRSIVTSIAGTTRDIVEETVRVGDIILLLSDTAGIRETDDLVEGIGVKLSREKMAESDFVIAVFDNSLPLTDEDKEILSMIKDINHLIIINKSDLVSKIDKDFFSEFDDRVIEISAHDNLSESVISDKISEILNLTKISTGVAVVNNERQKRCLDKAKEFLGYSINSISIGESYDALTILLDECTKQLLELSGEKITEAVVDEIFSKFCVGK